MSMTSEVNLDLDDEAPQGSAARDIDGVPYCRKHHCRMIQASGGKKGAGNKASYRCKVAGCEETAQRVKTVDERVVPKDPVACPRCSKENSPVICERSKSSTAQMIVLQCPRCSWKSSAFVVPHLAAAQLAVRKRPDVEEIGAR